MIQFLNENAVSCKLRKAVAAELKTIYAAPTVHQANLRFGEFEDKWGANYLLNVTQN